MAAPIIAASILTADFGNLYRVVRKLERAGVDRIHLDVMDGHFVPNLTFGPDVTAAIRRLTDLPLDLHLMIAQPSLFVDPFLRAGADSITFHVEAPEPGSVKREALEAIRAARRVAGLAISPGTPLAAVEPYRELLGIVMVMTVVPGAGGQRFLRHEAVKIAEARSLLAGGPGRGEVHVDGGVNRETAEQIGALAADVLVVGSALWIKGRNMGREIRLIRALADEGYQYGLNGGRPPIPRDRVVTFVTLPRHLARTLQGEIELIGIPVLLFRSSGPTADLTDEVRDWDVLLPASSEPAATGRFGARRDAMLDDAAAWRAAGMPDVPYVRAPLPPRPDEVVP